MPFGQPTNTSGSYAALGFTPANFPNFRKALANVQDNTGDCVILTVGDSTTRGTGGSQSPETVPQNQSWPFRCAIKSSTRLAVPSAHSLAISRCSFNSGADDRWTLGTGWSLAGFGAGNGCSTTGVAPAGNLVFTPGALAGSSDTYDIWYLKNTTLGSLNITATGGSTFPVVCAGTIGVGKATVTAASAATTNAVTITATGNAVYILAVQPRLAGTKQLLWANAGVSSSKTDDWANQGSPSLSGQAFIGAVAPNLTFISLGINDAINSVSAATFQANMQLLITKAKLSGDVILMPMQPTGSTVSGGVPLAFETLYQPIYQQLAAANNCGLIDNWNRFGGVNQTAFDRANFMNADLVHPNNNGYWDEQAEIMDYLTSVV